MRRLALGLFGVVAAGLIALVIVQASQSTNLAFTVGAAPQAPIAALKAGQTVCQRQLNVPPHAGFDQIALQVGTHHRPGPPLDVVVRNHDTGRILGRGTLRAGYPDIPTGGGDRVVATGAVAADQPIDVCVTNRGPRSVALYGSGALANRNSDAVLDGKETAYDVTMVFQDARHSRGSELADMFQRASLFRPGFVGAWTYWILVALMVLAVPALLWRALGGVTDAPTDPEPGPRADRV
ncbi:MAG TPA: hypothetical protein VI318_15975 [Baekduia sp.]